MRLLLPLAALILSSCAAIPAPSMPPVLARERGPFVPRDELPVPPNVERMIGPNDCRGATLAAVSAGLPGYPASAWNRGRQGWVVVRFDVGSDGQTGRVRIARAVPDGPFNRASRRAVADWRFRPLDDGQTLQNCVVMFEFRAGEVYLR
jgi:TonB family protein